MTEMIVDVAIALAGAALALSIAIVFWVLVRGPGTVDRAIALDMLGLLLASAACLIALAADQSAFLDIALGVSLVGFLAAVAVARLVEAHARPGSRDG
jgi:multicomponent Na+:H+ antiporter subunit F